MAKEISELTSGTTIEVEGRLALLIDQATANGSPSLLTHPKPYAALARSGDKLSDHLSIFYLEVADLRPAQGQNGKPAYRAHGMRSAIYPIERTRYETLAEQLKRAGI